MTTLHHRREADDIGEHEELTAIYVDRGLDPTLAKQVADQLMAHDALGAHARDELGISETLRARPIQAALASASSFAVGAAAPLLVTTIAPTSSLIIVVPGTTLLFLALLGALAAGAGGAGVTVGAVRVTFWGGSSHGSDRGRRGLIRHNRVTNTNENDAPSIHGRRHVSEQSAAAPTSAEVRTDGNEKRKHRADE